MFRTAALSITLCISVTLAKVPESPFINDPYPKEQGPLQVFILAGQSNMQGHASLRTLEYLIYNEETAADYEQWKDRMGGWVERSDVWIWTTDGDRFGKLKPGFGQSEMKIGPELGFGWATGERLDNQVLLIKTCWGGKSVKKDFLSPGSPLPTEEELTQELENAKKRSPNTTMDDIKAQYGFYYRESLRHIDNVLANLKDYFPQYDQKKGYKLAGLVFFQGWNDMVDGSQRAEQYARFTPRLAQMIKDFRKDLNAPDLPVVIGELGAGGKRGDFQLAQEKATQLPEFEGNVQFVKTVEFWEPDVEAIVNSDIWKGPEWTKFYNVGSEKGYHYLGSARIYTQMGNAFAEGMLKLLEKLGR